MIDMHLLDPFFEVVGVRYPGLTRVSDGSDVTRVDDKITHRAIP